MSSTMICAITAPNDGARAGLSLVLLAFQPLVNLQRRLAQQEQSAADQNEIPSRDVPPGDRDERRRQPDDPRNREEQHDPHQHRAEQTRAPRARLIAGGQLAGKNRNEDDVVDAEDDFEKRERDEREQALRTEECVHQRTRRAETVTRGI